MYPTSCGEGEREGEKEGEIKKNDIYTFCLVRCVYVYMCECVCETGSICDWSVRLTEVVDSLGSLIYQSKREIDS